MSFILKITISVIKRRIANGEKLEEVLLCYPKLSAEDKEIINREVTS